MRQRCEYCDNWIDDTDAVCPHCGAPNEHMMASSTGVPKTIAELKAFAVAHNLPLEQMRFFIGENYTKPRAFGIYQDGENFVVYKNKADGSRAVRYQGKDEAYAVNELYQKMKSEVANQKNRLGSSKAAQAQKTMKRAQRKARVAQVFAIVGLVSLLGAGAFFIWRMPSRGYYAYDDTTYYYQNSDWYYWDASGNSWERDVDPPDDLVEHNNDYWSGSSWDSSSGTTDFADSIYYEAPSSSSSDDDDDDWDDDDWSWDSSDSWDSSATDWDSDW